jgi:hypothetical protein
MRRAAHPHGIRTSPTSLIPAAAHGVRLKVTIVAVMRKIITTLNAMIRDNVAWDVRST